MHYQASAQSVPSTGVKRSLLGLKSTRFPANFDVAFYARGGWALYEQCQTIRPMQCVTKMNVEHKKAPFVESDTSLTRHLAARLA